MVASRDHLCVNPAINVNKGFALNAACKNAQKGLNLCGYYKNRDKGKESMPWGPLDIEELHKVAEEGKYCPYYASKERAAIADLIFMPYNYLIDEKIRENFDIDYSNSIIIFDEAHNIAACTEEVTSFELRAANLESCLAEVHAL